MSGVSQKAALTAMVGALSCVGASCNGGRPPPASQFPDAAAALSQMKETYACANGIQGEGKLDHVGEAGRVRGDVLLFAINPARVRIDVISSFGAMLYTLTSNGQSFELLDTQEKTFLHGPASACNLARLTQVPVPGHVLVSLLRGEAPLLVHEAPAPTLVWQNGRYEVAIASKHDARQEIYLLPYEEDWTKPFAEQRLEVHGVSVFQRGATVYEATMSGHELAHTAPPREDEEGLEETIPPSGGACDVKIPREIQIVVPSTGDDVVFDYEDVAFNPPIPAGAFDQPVPGGVQKQFVDCKD